MNPVKLKVDESVNDMRFEQKVEIVEEVLQQLCLTLGESFVRFGLRSHLRDKGFRVIRDSVLMAFLTDVTNCK